jgi:hypothetical protein
MKIYIEYEIKLTMTGLTATTAIILRNSAMIPKKHNGR